MKAQAPARATQHSAQALRCELAAIFESLGTVAVKPCRAALDELGARLAAGFDNGISVNTLVRLRADCVDALLGRVWCHYLAPDHPHAALVAVGGYGRAELLPQSDIDLLVLYREGHLEALRSGLESFIAFTWDVGLQIGHSVRSPAECEDQARSDVTVITNLMEARRLVGDPDLFAALQARLQPPALWPASAFFQAKVAEQRARHAHYDESAYKLEPNVKESPGGLRDIQTITWVAQRHFGTASLDGLVTHGFLTDGEVRDLRRGRSFLWRVRFALHTGTGRREDRLLFDYQIKVARLLGYRDHDHDLAVEQCMQDYYKTIKNLSALNDILLQVFAEAILHAGEDPKPTPINERFQTALGFIEARAPDLFQRDPAALLEIFRLMQNQPRITGIRAQTLRLIRRDRVLIDSRLREDPRCRRLFVDILRQGSGVTHALRRMNRYGILGRYLPVFGRIIGRMQFDLFHTLTVDEHSLFVIRNLRRLALPRFDHESPFASRVMQGFDKTYLLYVVGLFHDVAKGRGGDHSELGAADAADFCARHNIVGADRDLVCWLIRHHLLMSMTAQRKDIHDPAVIHEFARVVGNRERLDRLFVFTVCDIRGTNPSLWNSWRQSLLIELYNQTRRSLERGLEEPLEQAELVAETRSAAAAMLTRDRVRTPHFKAVWARLDEDYFLRHSPAEIAWHTAAIVNRRGAGDNPPLVLVAPVGAQGVTVFVYTRERDYLFALTTGVLAQLGLSVLDARISSTGDGYAVDSYVITEQDGNPISRVERRDEIAATLAAAIANPKISEVRVTRRSSRRSRAFSVATRIHFHTDIERQHSVLELTTADRPGLLSSVGRVFHERGILIATAKIATIGERAEDVFQLTDRNHQPVADPDQLQDLEQTLVRLLDRAEA